MEYFLLSCFLKMTFHNAFQVDIDLPKLSSFLFITQKVTLVRNKIRSCILSVIIMLLFFFALLLRLGTDKRQKLYHDLLGL